MRAIILILFILSIQQAVGQKNKQSKVQESEDHSCEKLLESAKQAMKDKELTQARDYCEAGLLICDDLTDSFQSVLKLVNNEIDSQKREVKKALDSVVVVSKLNESLVNAFFFNNNRYALAFNAGRYGFVKKNGETFIDFKYTSAIPFGSKYGFAIVKKRDQGAEYFLDTTKIEYQLTRNIANLRDTSNKACITTIRSKADRLNIIKAKQLKILFLEDSKGINRVIMRRLITELKSIPNLTSLGMQKIGLSDLPKELFEIKTLVSLDLSGNNLTELSRLFPETLPQIDSLKKLDLSNNNLKSLPIGIKKFTRLESLNLLGNSISTDEQKRIKGLLPKKCQVIFQDYLADPLMILDSIKYFQAKKDTISLLKEYERLTTLLNKSHREIPDDQNVKVMLFRAKGNMEWWKSWKLIGDTRNPAIRVGIQKQLIDSLAVFTEEVPNDINVRRQFAQSYGNLSDYLLYTHEFIESEKVALSGLSIDPSQVYIKLNLAHALLWQDKFDQAESAYRNYFGGPGSNRLNYLKTAKADFEAFRKAGLPFGDNQARIEALMAKLEAEK